MSQSKETNEVNKSDQIIVTGRISNNAVDGEVIKFPLHLGPFHLFFIVNVPSEGETEAPVYVKFRVGLERKERTEPEVRVARAKRPARRGFIPREELQSDA